MLSVEVEPTLYSIYNDCSKLNLALQALSTYSRMIKFTSNVQYECCTVQYSTYLFWATAWERATGPSVDGVIQQKVKARVSAGRRSADPQLGLDPRANPHTCAH